MSLLDGMRQTYATIKRTMIPDGLGGWIPGAWANDKTFEAAISTDLSTEAVIGGAVTTRSNYTFAIPLDMELAHGQLFKRLSDGQFFRITSHPPDMHPPSYSMFPDYQITATATESPEGSLMSISELGVVMEGSLK